MNEVINNTTQGRYELRVESGHVAVAEYSRGGNTLQINHVEVPSELRGGGVAGKLMEGVVALARKEGVTLAPVCSYAVAWFRRHPEHNDVLGYIVEPKD